LERHVNRIVLTLILLIIHLTPSIVLGNEGKCVQGDCVNGRGTFTVNGEEYIGEWKGGKRHGQGILNFPDGGKYIGEWKDDLPNGQGTEINPDGTKYEGQFKDGVKIGQGREISSDVTREGELKDREKEIEKYDSAEKCIEKGHCKPIQGLSYYTNGSSYEGEFLRMLPHGSGFYILPDGTSVSSQTSNNLPHGKGKFITHKGEIIEGNFILGKQVTGDVNKNLLAEAEKIKFETATPVEQEGEPEPKVILPQNLKTTNAVEYARISVGANIRSDASLSSDVLHTVPPGYPVAVLAKQTDWLLVEDYQGRKGWVFASLVKEPTTVIIKVFKGNLRSGPSLKDDIITQLDHGKILPVLGRSGEWLKVSDFEGLTGWLHHTVIWPAAEMNARYE
jgi:SH3-like domain-containing protein